MPEYSQSNTCVQLFTFRWIVDTHHNLFLFLFFQLLLFSNQLAGICVSFTSHNLYNSTMGHVCQCIISILSLNTHVRTRHKRTCVILNAKKSCNLIADSRGYNLKCKSLLYTQPKKWTFLQQGNSNINTRKFISKKALSHFFSVVEFISNKRSIHFPN